MNSNYLAGFLRIIVSITLPILGALLANVFYIKPFFTSPSEVTADPTGFMSLFFGASIGLLIITLPNLIFRLVKKQEMPVRFIYIALVSFGILAVFANELLYQVVIQPNHMIECPLKLGYKKNLMRDYVLNASQCERF